MPSGFLSAEQKTQYGQYVASPTAEQLSQYFFLADSDKEFIGRNRTPSNRLGIAIQLSTVRFLGTFLGDPAHIPLSALLSLAKQLNITNPHTCLKQYRTNKHRWAHTTLIEKHYGYQKFVRSGVTIKMLRWLYTLCWTGTDQPSLLFARTTQWLLANKVLLPGSSTLERIIARVRQRINERVWEALTENLTDKHKASLEALLIVAEGEKTSKLEQLRPGPLLRSTHEMIKFLDRLDAIRALDIHIPVSMGSQKGRILNLARLASIAKVTAISRFTPQRRLATLVAFVHTLEAKGQDDVLELLEVLIRDIFARSTALHQKARLRTLRDLDRAARLLHKVGAVLLDKTVRAHQIRKEAFKKVSEVELKATLDRVAELTESPEEVYTTELQDQYRRVRYFLPRLLKAITFKGSPAGQSLVKALEHFKAQDTSKPFLPLPACTGIIVKKWEKHVIKNGQLDTKAYTFCLLERFQGALKKRDVFVTPSILYADPRIGLLEGDEWKTACPLICSSLNLTPLPEPLLKTLGLRLDATYKKVADNLPNNLFLRIETIKDTHDELILTHLDELPEPDSLKALRQAVNARIPRVDLPDLLLEVATHTAFADLFTHISEKGAKIDDFTTSISAALLSEACNLGIEPLIRHDIPALRRSRLIWILQNYFRHETLSDANNRLVSAQNKIQLAQAWGGGDVASADGLRFVVPIRSLQAGPNPKYYASENGVTYYNLVSDQFTGLAAATVTGTLKDSLVLLGVVLGQSTELTPTEIMTDTGAYSDTIFALFHLLGYQFSPRIADTGGSRLWRIDRAANYGVFNRLSRHRVNTGLIIAHWDDILRLVGSLKLGTVQAHSVMRMLQIGDSPTKLAQALREFGKIIKTIHLLEFMNDEEKRRRILTQLNRGEGRHSLARAVFYAKRGELREKYREGQEDKLGALGLVVNVIILWNTIYMDAALTQLKAGGEEIKSEDVKRLSPLSFGHINLMGRYAFVTPDCIAKGKLRPLRNPLNTEED